MRTTVTLEPDVEALVRKLMTERGLSFKEAVNSAIRSGLAGPHEAAYEVRTYSLGEPTVSLDKALQLAGSLEDEEIVRKLSVGK